MQLNKNNPNKKWAGDLNRHFSKEDNRHMKRSPIIREMQIKTTLRYHLTPVRMAISKISQITKVGEDVEKREHFVHCMWECKLVQPLRQTVWNFLKKLKIELPYDPAISLLGIYQKKIKALIQKDTYTTMIVAALFTISKIWNQPKCSSVD